MQIYAARPELGVDLQRVWPLINHFINDVCSRSRGQITPQSFRDAVERGDADLWIIADEARQEMDRFRAIISTQIGYTMSGMKVCNIILVAGKNRHEWLHLIEVLAAWARNEGCKKFRLLPRKGWDKDLKKLKGYNFRQVAIEMEMDLEDAGKDRDDQPQPDEPGKVVDAAHTNGIGRSAGTL